MHDCRTYYLNSGTFQNDFLALTQAFSLPEIDYTDISQREQLAAAIKRWPLLAEFAHQQ
ncbi:hypothetical protein SS21_07160 [Enterobacter roggenkampii]|uniref:cellulose biosynthesis protein BcsR n=1 Tax=Enterobacter roggenkampii TaxID=1812935 RepID=UPI0005F0ACE1|nr:cellulose biosynthesis protein BcsR [Enterobacter roggenkampii]KJM90024.1 hypothetical protein SS21_07160 [Enterobacter roggenkampii]